MSSNFAVKALAALQVLLAVLYFVGQPGLSLSKKAGAAFIVTSADQVSSTESIRTEEVVRITAAVGEGDAVSVTPIADKTSTKPPSTKPPTKAPKVDRPPPKKTPKADPAAPATRKPEHLPLQPYVITLEHRTDRLTQFRKELAPLKPPFPDPVPFRAVNGSELVGPAEHWDNWGEGVVGCYKSHYNLLDFYSRVQKAYPTAQAHQDHLLVFEDDAYCVKDFSKRLVQFMKVVPDDWDMIFLGGQLHEPPVNQAGSTNVSAFGDDWWRLYGIKNTVSYMVNAKSIDAVRRHIEAKHVVRKVKNHYEGTPIDLVYSRLLGQKILKGYVPPRMMCSQHNGFSDVVQASGRWHIKLGKDHRWQGLRHFKAKGQPKEMWHFFRIDGDIFFKDSTVVQKNTK